MAYINRTGSISKSIAVYEFNFLVKRMLNGNVVLPARVKKFLSLFQIFSFKGLGYSMSKSMRDWDGVGFGIKIPLTSNFPVYDSLVHLPRLNLFAGVNYPYALRSSLSISLPLHTVLYNGCTLIKSKDYARALFKKRKATDSIRRVGFTITYKLDKDGLRYQVGPWVVRMPMHILYIIQYN